MQRTRHTTCAPHKAERRQLAENCVSSHARALYSLLSSWSFLRPNPPDEGVPASCAPCACFQTLSACRVLARFPLLFQKPSLWRLGALFCERLSPGGLPLVQEKLGPSLQFSFFDRQAPPSLAVVRPPLASFPAEASLAPFFSPRRTKREELFVFSLTW